MTSEIITIDTKCSKCVGTHYGTNVTITISARTSRTHQHYMCVRRYILVIGNAVEVSP